MKQKSIFRCASCGAESGKWAGRCASCGEWETIEEFAAPKTKNAAPSRASIATLHSLNDVESDSENRVATGLGEFDRVLGGGIVEGSLVLVGGDPGIGKSTLLLQICQTIADGAILYISGEESARQIKLRADRLKVSNPALSLLADTDIYAITNAIEKLKPALVIVDSIQTMQNPDIASLPGSVSQVRECTMSFLKTAKSMNIPIFVVGHMTKDGYIAGPKVLEHIVDCVLYFEGERHQFHRVLRAVKNRFGSTNEIGVFEMKGDGLAEVANPSLMLLEGRPLNAPGSCVAATIEGTRPLLAEVQGLAVRTHYPAPRRSSTGIDYNRVMLLIAVLEKRVGLNFATHDAYVNVIGGLSVTEPGADLAAALALASSHKDMYVPESIAAIGEIGLTGEIRAVTQIERRVAECRKMGFTRIALPKGSRVDVPRDVSLIYVDTLKRAIDVVLSS